MPKVEWKNLPRPIRQHLYQRAAQRNITYMDLERLAAWIETNPEAPEGEWVKDFGSFKLVGEGAYPKTFLLQGQAARGQRIK